MVTVFFDGQPYAVKPGRNLLEAALDHGLNLPYFCWHPLFRSIGACRQCAVRLFAGPDDTVGRIQMACMTDAREGTRASIDDPGAIAFRRSVIEWLMINHPHDCPVCDEGGECHLQDMTVMSGHVERRYRGRKRTFVNQDLGPFVTHEMNRCIQCYRCVRFYRDVAGGRDFSVYGSRNRLYFGRVASGRLESPFSGNLVEVCPTGVFTDKTLARHYTRKWDLETAASLCPHCGEGCNTLPGARYGELRRVQARFHDRLNGHFLCDRGRFGYEFSTAPERLRQGWTRTAGTVPGDQALAAALQTLRRARRTVGLTSGTASLEASFALGRLVGLDNLGSGLPAVQHAALEALLSATRERGLVLASLEQVRQADAVLLLGVDPTAEAPLLELALRQAVDAARFRLADEQGIPRWHDAAIRDAARGARYPLQVLTTVPLPLEEIARVVLRAAPEQLLGLAQQLAERLGAPDVGPDQPLARIARSLQAARRPLIVTSAAAGPELVRAAATLVEALRQGPRGSRHAAWHVVVPEANSVGVALLGARPTEEVLAEIEAGRADGLIVLENDLERLVGPARAARVRRQLAALVVLDALPSPTVSAADVVLPASVWAESSGSWVNAEGRAQRFFQVLLPEQEQLPAWWWLAELQRGLSAEPVPWQTFEEVTRVVEAECPRLTGVLQAAPTADFRLQRMKLPRAPQRATGRTAMYAHQGVHDLPPTDDPETPYAYSMEGSELQPPPALLHRVWAPGWNSVQALTRLQQEAGGPLRGGSAGVRLLDPPGFDPAGAEPEEAGPAGTTRSAPLGPPTEPGPPERHVSPTPPSHEGLWLVPAWRLFGSERLSRHGEAVSRVVSPASLTLHPTDAEELGLAAAGGLVELPGLDGGAGCPLPVVLDDRLPRRVALLPAGYPEAAGRWTPRREVLRVVPPAGTSTPAPARPADRRRSEP